MRPPLMHYFFQYFFQIFSLEHKPLWIINIKIIIVVGANISTFTECATRDTQWSNTQVHNSLSAMLEVIRIVTRGLLAGTAVIGNIKYGGILDISIRNVKFRAILFAKLWH